MFSVICVSFVSRDFEIYAKRLLLYYVYLIIIFISQEYPISIRSSFPSKLETVKITFASS